MNIPIAQIIKPLMSQLLVESVTKNGGKVYESNKSCLITCAHFQGFGQGSTT